MIKEAIQTAVEGKDLTSDTVKEVMDEIMTGNATETEMAAYLTALRMKKETIEEITASAQQSTELTEDNYQKKSEENIVSTIDYNNKKRNQKIKKFIIFVVVFLNFCVEIAIRSVKLAVLRLIAPIPIISYMDPKGSKDSAFNSWVKTLTSTYLDLFIRLAAVYFAIFLIQDMITNGVVINHGHGVIGAISLILIWIGIFVFAKQAPKFIKDVLGLKGDSGKLFGGLGDALAVGAMGAGVVGGAVSRGAAAFSNNNNNK